MQPSSTQPQGHTQDRLTYTSQGYVPRSSPVRAPHPTPQAFGFTQPVTPHHDPQPRTQGTFRDPISMQPGAGNDAYWGTPGNGFSRTSMNSLGTGAPPPWRSGEYVPPYFPYGHFGQGGIDHSTGFPVVAGQVSNYAMNFSHSFPGTSAPQTNQGATPVWQLSDCWVNYESQGELHLTIVLKKFPFA